MIQTISRNKKKAFSTAAVVLLGAVSVFGLQSCGGGGGGDSSTATSFIVTANAGANGAISPAGATVNQNETADFSVTPDTGYQIDNVSGCSGTLSGNTYSTGAITADCTVSASFVQIVTHTVTTTAGANGSITPTNATVNANDSTSFTVTANSGFLIDTVSGCAGSLVADTYTTGPITADCTVNANFVQELGGVSALFSNAANWNDYVAGAQWSSANNIACAPVSDTACLHGGEHRVLEVTGTSSCTGLSVVEDLGAFDWVCDDSTGTARFISTGLTDGKYLSDLIDFTTPDFKPNTIRVYDNGVIIGATTSANWWTNPVAINNSGGNLTITSVLYLVTANPAAGYSINADKIGLVVQPGIILNGPGSNTNIITATNKDHIWLEGHIDATGDIRGTAISASFSVFSHLTVNNSQNTGINITADNTLLRDIILNNNPTYGIIFFGDNNTFNNIETNNSINGTGIYIEGNNNTLSDILATNSSANGIHINNSTNIELRHVHIIGNNAGYGIAISSSSDSTITDTYLVNNSSGLFLGAASNNTFSNITAVNNTNGIFGSHSLNSNNRFSSITLANNTTGYGVSNNASSILIGVTAANQASYGISTGSSNETYSNMAITNNSNGLTTSGSFNTFADLSVVNNLNHTIWLLNSSNNTFTGRLDVDSQSGNCVVVGGTNPGVDMPTCANNGTSDASLTVDVSHNNSYVGKVTTNDASNTSDSNGSATFPTNPETFDWTNFDNPFRAWGIDGSAFPNNDHKDVWTAGAGRIWDWSISTADTGNGGSPALLAVLTLPTGNDTLTHTWTGTPASNDNTGCNAMVNSSVWNGSACETALLRRAVEILHDGIGNENNLCESGETCLYTPNIGSYQGHGDLVSAGVFTAGTLTGITLMKYANNGR